MLGTRAHRCSPSRSPTPPTALSDASSTTGAAALGRGGLARRSSARTAWLRAARLFSPTCSGARVRRVHALCSLDPLGSNVRIERPRDSGPRDGGAPAFAPGRGAGRRTDYRIIVENLPPNTSWQDLKDLVRDAGTVLFTNVTNGVGYARRWRACGASALAGGRVHGTCSTPLSASCPRVQPWARPGRGGHAAERRRWAVAAAARGRSRGRRDGASPARCTH